MTTLPPITFGTGASFLGNASLPGIEDILLFVDKGSVTGFEDGTRQNPFHVIADALTAAAALTPGAARRVTLMIYPGEYSEDGLTSVDYCSWVGVGGRDAVRIESTGAATILTVTHEHTSYWGITFAEAGGASGVIVSGAMTGFVEFHECAFYGAGLDQAVYVTSGANGRFTDCLFYNPAARAFLTSAAAGSEVLLKTCQLYGQVYIIDAGIRLTDCLVSGLLWSATTDYSIVESCTLSNAGGHCIFYTATPSSGVVRNNKMACAAASYDVIADVARAGFVIEGNEMTHGMSANVSHVKSERNVGAAGDLDFYATLQAALTSCTFDGIVVKMLKDEAIGAALSFPAGRTVTVDGNGKHSVTFVGGLLMLVDGTKNVTMRDLLLSGVVNQTASGKLTLEDCVCTAFSIGFYVATAALAVRLRRTAILSPFPGVGCIFSQSASGDIFIEDSYLKGAAGLAAIVWDAGITNNNLKIRRSKVFHGSLGANNPFGRNAAQTPTWKGYQNEFNADPDSFGWSTNLVAAGQQQSSFDVNTDFF